jgi:DMSO/TMAO reductase YedYZ heme-binding membrane subunit
VSGPLPWYVARATGLVAYALVTVAVVWGLLISGRPFGRRLSAPWLLDLHRFLGGLAVAFVGLHLGALVADQYVHFGIAELLVPMRSTWRPGPTALGIVAFDLLVAVELTSLAMRRLPRRTWRMIHRCSFVSFWLSTLHFLTAGSDARGSARLVAIAAASAVLFLTIYRVVVERGSARRQPAEVPAAA